MIKYRRLTLSVWKKYYTILNQKNKSEYAVHFIKQMRECNKSVWFEYDDKIVSKPWNREIVYLELHCARIMPRL
jgi:hypothetical protein